MAIENLKKLLILTHFNFYYGILAKIVSKTGRYVSVFFNCFHKRKTETWLKLKWC